MEVGAVVAVVSGTELVGVAMLLVGAAPLGARVAEGVAAFAACPFPCVVNVQGTPPLLNRLSPVAI